MRQHHRARRPWAIIGRGQQPAEHRAKSHHLEERSVDDTGLDQARLPAEPDQREIDGGKIAEGGNSLGARLEVIDFGDREGQVLDAEALGGLADVDQPIRLPIDERTQEHAPNHAENRRVGADAQSERHHHGARQAFGTGEGAQGEPDIPCERFSGIVPTAVPDAPHLVAHGGHVPELRQRRAPRLHRIVAAVDALLDVDGQVAADLLVEVALVGSFVGFFISLHPPVPGS